jgi:hypothetical protein
MRLLLQRNYEAENRDSYLCAAAVTVRARLTNRQPKVNGYQ